MWKCGNIFNFRISQGSVATYCRWGGNLCDIYIEHFSTNHLVKEFWKSVHICQSYNQTSRDVVIYALDLVNYALRLVKCALDLVKRAPDLVIYALHLIKHALDLINYVLDLVNYEEVYSPLYVLDQGLYGGPNDVHLNFGGQTPQKTE